MFFVKFGSILKKSLKCIRNFCLIMDIFSSKAYFLYANMIVLMLVNNFRYCVPDFTRVGPIWVEFIVIIYSFGFSYHFFFHN